MKFEKHRTLDRKSFWKGSRFPCSVLVLIIVTISFYPSLDNQFVNWDDDVNLLENPYVHDLTWTNIKSIFTTTVIGGYNPLSIVTLAIEHAIFGQEDAFIYHLDNLILHLICVFFVYRIGFLLGLNVWGSVLLALLFGIHPMRVESVAWVTERKDVLYGAFYLSALCCYIQYLLSDRKNRNLWYWTVGLFTLSLFSKIQAVALPLSMLTIDYYFGRPLRFRLIKEKSLLFLMSLAVGLLGYFLLQQEGVITAEDPIGYNFLERILVASYSYVVYLVKFIYPYEMSPLYPYVKSLTWEFYIAPVLLLILVGCTYWAFRQKRKEIVFGISFFTFNIFFLLQFVGAGQGFIADRFTYMAYLGLFYIAAWYFQSVVKNRPRWKIPILLCSLVYLGMLGVMTWNQNEVWQHGGTLWSHAIGVNDQNATVWANRANYYRDHQQLDRALQDYAQAISLNPKGAALYNSRGKAYSDQGLFPESLRDYNQAVLLDPENPEYFSNRSVALGELKRYDEALNDLATAIELDPDYKMSYKNRLVILYALGQYEQALPDHVSYLNLDPYDADIWYSKALTHRQLGDESAALESLNMAIKYDPGQNLFWFERAKVNTNVGYFGQALQDAEQAQKLGMQIDPAIMEMFRTNDLK